MRHAERDLGLILGTEHFLREGGGVALVNYQKINSRRAKRAEKKIHKVRVRRNLMLPKTPLLTPP